MSRPFDISFFFEQKLVNVSLRVIQNFLNYVFQAQVTNREARQLVAKKSLFVVLSFSPQMALVRARTKGRVQIIKMEI